jgi:formyltetrahydrofolate deformylase
VLVRVGQEVQEVPRGVARLLVRCPDRPGIVAEISSFLRGRGANIVSSDQHSSDPQGGTFFMRMVFTLGETPAELADAFGRDVAGDLGGDWLVTDAERPKRVAIAVSREDHCLLDLLWRHRRGELFAEIPVVISNHPHHAADVSAFGIAYEHVPVPRGGKPEAEARIVELLRDRVDLLVLARYMQILTPEFLEAVGLPIINIHHSFLPAFPGADPYGRAFERGVKVIGATAHYVTEELDEGPIIAQDVAHVTHRDDADQLVRIGRDIERTVLARAVRAHLEDRVLVDGHRTVVF